MTSTDPTSRTAPTDAHGDVASRDQEHPVRNPLRPVPRPTTGQPRRRRVVPFQLAVVLTRVGIVVAVLAAWEIASDTKSINPVLFSKPSEVARRLVDLLNGVSIDPITNQTIYQQIEATVQEWAIGFAIGSVVAILCGLALGRSRFLSAVLQPLILMFHSLPMIALAPIFILTLGIGVESKIGIAALLAFFGAFFQVYAGVREIPDIQIQLARIMGVSRVKLLTKVLLPASSSFIIVGLRVAVPMAMTGAIIGEFVASSEGLGWYIVRASASLDAPSLFASLLILMVLVSVLLAILTILERRVLRWKPRASGPIADR